MTEPSEAAMEQAEKLAMSVARERGKESIQSSDWVIAFARHIQHTSDVAKKLMEAPFYGDGWKDGLKSLILPDDEPDPRITEIVEAAWPHRIKDNRALASVYGPKSWGEWFKERCN